MLLTTIPATMLHGDDDTKRAAMIDAGAKPWFACGAISQTAMSGGSGPCTAMPSQVVSCRAG